MFVSYIERLAWAANLCNCGKNLIVLIEGHACQLDVLDFTLSVSGCQSDRSAGWPRFRFCITDFRTLQFTTIVINCSYIFMTTVVNEQEMKKRRTRVRLAAGEIEILEILWRDKSVTISQTHATLERNVGYTTVQTRLNRMVDKGLVRKSGSHPARYVAAIQPDEVSRRDLDVLVRRVTGGQVVPLVAHLVKDRELSHEEIRELKDLILEVERNSKSKRRIEDER